MLGVVLAAGKGTRLQGLSKDIPKPLIPIGDKTCLDHIILGMKSAGILQVALVIGHRGEQIVERYGKGKELGVQLTYLPQDLNIYGTGRAVQLAEDFAAGKPFLLSYGDILIEPSNYAAMMQLAKTTKDTVSSVNWIDDPFLGAAVYLSEDGFVDKITEKPSPGQSGTNWNNAGVYVFQPIIFDYLRNLQKSKRGEYELTEAIRQMLAAGVPIRAYTIRGYWRDIGRPEDVIAMEELLGHNEEEV